MQHDPAESIYEFKQRKQNIIIFLFRYAVSLSDLHIPSIILVFLLKIHNFNMKL